VSNHPTGLTSSPQILIGVILGGKDKTIFPSNSLSPHLAFSVKRTQPPIFGSLFLGNQWTKLDKLGKIGKGIGYGFQLTSLLP